MNTLKTITTSAAIMIGLFTSAESFAHGNAIVEVPMGINEALYSLTRGQAAAFVGVEGRMVRYDNHLAVVNVKIYLKGDLEVRFECNEIVDDESFSCIDVTRDRGNGGGGTGGHDHSGHDH